MDIYITNLKTKERLTIPMLPQEINGTIKNNFATYNILKKGEVRIPTGTALDGYTWEAYFPGMRRKKDPFVRKWTKPKKCDKFMRGLKASSGKPIKARLLITGTSINLDVYLESYNPVETGGYGDIKYSVSFIRAKKIMLNEKNPSKDSEELKNTSKSAERTEPQKPAKETYTVSSGDSLWKIAQKNYGDGKQYTKIYEANKETIGSDPNKILAGQVLTIP